MAQSKSSSNDWSIVATDKFVSAMRDSGYNSTASAISELVDNSLQARASRIEIDIKKTENNNIEISVTDNGCGMDLFTLRQALRFGGSTRFNDRSGLGRFGMGLPNSSFSQARRVTVTSWCRIRKQASHNENVVGSGLPIQAHLDIDEIMSGKMTEVPPPKKLEKSLIALKEQSGTVVQWESCDLLDFKRVSTIVRHTSRELSQRFRYFLEQGTRILVNGSILKPIDPMFIVGRTEKERSIRYGDDIHYRISVNPDDATAGTGLVRVRFVELPVSKWAVLNNEEKREKGIVKNAGVSVIRSGREVDYGWYFFGDKRKENYDDWWRCEVSFDPILDEAFGLTHTKQQIRPQQYLLDILAPDMEMVARTLNARARAAHNKVRQSVNRRKSEKIAEDRSRFLRPIPSKSYNNTRAFLVKESSLKDDCFYAFQFQRGTIEMTLDRDHAFYREIYMPLLESGNGGRRLKTLIELLLLAAARAEAAAPEHSQILKDFRASWGKAAETFIGG